jgi:hypothetical protein
MTHDQELSILWCENKQLQPKKKKKKKKKKKVSFDPNETILSSSKS